MHLHLYKGAYPALSVNLWRNFSELPNSVADLRFGSQLPNSVPYSVDTTALPGNLLTVRLLAQSQWRVYRAKSRFKGAFLKRIFRALYFETISATWLEWGLRDISKVLRAPVASAPWSLWQTWKTWTNVNTLQPAFLKKKKKNRCVFCTKVALFADHRSVESAFKLKTRPRGSRFSGPSWYWELTFLLSLYPPAQHSAVLSFRW